jgi:proteasome lid subunit RPN8/RPN11
MERDATPRAVPPGLAERAAVVPDASLPPATLAGHLALEVFAHARECYPEECCGLLIGRPDGEPVRVVRCTNVQSLRRSSGESELDAAHGFWVHEGELLRALREAEAHGEEVLGIYHSHVDSGAYLSHADLRGALGSDGRPQWPRAAQLVVAVREGVVHEAALFEWSQARGCYEGRVLRESH